MYSSWGLNTVASDWIRAGYANPYASGNSQTVVVYAPSQSGSQASTTVYDYSQPIDTTAVPAAPETAESAHRIFESARQNFRSGQYDRALMLADQALAELPNDPALHEFRALTLFAVGRFDDAAAAEYAALSAGPGWDWATLSGLYADVEEYTRQLRALEDYVARNPDSAGAQFLLGYHYLVQGHQDDAAAHFAQAAELRPADQLSAKFAESLSRKSEPTPAAPAPSLASSATSTSQPPADTTAAPVEDDQPPPAPPAEMAGTWLAEPGEGVKITLSLAADGGFTWAVTQNGRTQTIQGQAGYQDDVLILGQEEGPPLAGAIEMKDANASFTFKPPGTGDDVGGLTFMRQTS